MTPRQPGDPAAMGARGEAGWIWDAFHRQTPNQLMLLRRTVALTAPAVGGALQIAARGSFRVWVNAVMVAHHDPHGPAPGAESIHVDLAPGLAGPRPAAPNAASPGPAGPRHIAPHPAGPGPTGSHPTAPGPTAPDPAGPDPAALDPAGPGPTGSHPTGPDPAGPGPGHNVCSLDVVIGVYLLGVGTHHQPRALGGLLVTGSVREASGTVHRLDSPAGWTTCTPAFWRQNTPQMAWSTGFTEWWDHTAPAADVAGAVAGGHWSAAVTYPDRARPVPYRREVVETTLDLRPSQVEHGLLRTAPGLRDSRAAQCVAAGATRAAYPGEPPTTAAEADGRYHLFHLASQVVGFLDIEVHADQPCVVDVIAGEAVDEHGWPTATRQGIEAIDTITVPCGTTAHRFWHRRTFRALAIIMWTTAPASLPRVAVHTVTAGRPRPEFRCGIDRYDRMFEISVVTAAAGRQDLYEDCPLREGGHYVADARVQALFDLASTGTSSLARRSILQFAAAQDPDGMIPALSPSGTRHRIPDFSLQWVSYVDDYLRFTGDGDLLRRVTPALERAMAWADSRWDTPAGRWRADEPGWWPFVDWYGFTGDALPTALNAQYAVALHAAAELAGRAGDPGRAARHRERLAAVLAALPEPVTSPHAAALLLCGLPPRLALPRVAPGALRGFVADTGYWNFWVCLAHLARGDAGAAWRLLCDYWGGMLDAGAGTWWERYAPARSGGPPADASLCHPWSAGPLVLLPMLLGGVDPFARDPSRRRFEPIDLGAAPTLTLHTPDGIVRSRRS